MGSYYFSFAIRISRQENDFNNWFNWIKKDEKFSDLLNEIGSEDDELFTKKAYKSNIYKEFIEIKLLRRKSIIIDW